MKPAHSLTMVDRLDDTYRNPIALAKEWKEALADGKYATQKALAQDMGVHSTSVTKALSLLRLHPDVLRAVTYLGGPLARPARDSRESGQACWPFSRRTKGGAQRASAEKRNNAAESIEMLRISHFKRTR